ncbi:MAG: lactonase family protein [Dehalococcoidia bacterium]|nr:lactonase family protein [Dehalococcoidia bacterium]
MTQSQHTFLFVGTYTRTTSEGIYVYRMDNSTGVLERVAVTGGIKNPTFLALSPDNSHLYAVAEINEHCGRPTGAVYSYSVSPDSGDLAYVNQQSTGGPGPCHLTVDATGAHVIVANYQGGSICVLPIQTDGSLGEMSEFIQHEGSSVIPHRQREPHAHSVNLDPNNRFIYAPDLGMDKVMIYQLDLDSGNLLANKPAFVQVAPGAGPRHFAFHPDGTRAYVLNEIGNTVTAFNWDPESGSLEEFQTVTTLPADFLETSHTADLHIHPNGRFLYGSNRGHDSIAIFEIDPDTGGLTPRGWASTQGRTPRNIAIDPSGQFMLAENQDSDSIFTFRINDETGMLITTGSVIKVPMPVCIKFLA